MAKSDEIRYPENMASVLNVPEADVVRHLLEKPFGDPLRGRYFTDMGELLSLLPPPPARILDLGVGSGWTSQFLAKCGYSIVGVDISPTMIRLAQSNNTESERLSFHVCDYEDRIEFGLFDAVVVYDALHHATDEFAVIRNAYQALKGGGLFVTMEPGRGHSTAPHSIEAMKRFGVTEKDMEYVHQRAHMVKAGFSEVRQFVRLSELSLHSVAQDKGARQLSHLNGLVKNTAKHGISSVVVAVK